MGTAATLMYELNKNFRKLFANAIVLSVRSILENQSGPEVAARWASRFADHCASPEDFRLCTLEFLSANFA